MTAYREVPLAIDTVHCEPPDMDKLCELLIRFTLQDFGEAQAKRASQEVPETLRRDPPSDRRRSR